MGSNGEVTPTLGAIGDTDSANVPAPMPSHRPLRRMLLLIAAVGLLGIAGWFGYQAWHQQQQADNGATLGIAPLPKSATTPTNLNQTVALTGNCFKSYQVQQDGQNADSSMHYLVSVKLVGSPADRAALYKLMATDICAKALTDLQAMLLKDPVFAANANALAISYQAANGAQFFEN